MPWRCFMAQNEVDKTKPGAMWFEEIKGRRVWVVVLPCRDLFYQDQQTSDGRNAWTCTGEPPNVTVNPSINYVGLYHGWLRNGELSDDPAIPRDADGKPLRP